MQNILSLINDPTASPFVKLEGDIRLEDTEKKRISFGKKQAMHGIVEIRRPNIVIDGAGAVLTLETDGLDAKGLCLFRIHKEAENVRLRNLTIRVRLTHTTPSAHSFFAIYNNAYGLRIENCHIEVTSTAQANLYGVYNDGDLNTHLTTPADNLMLTETTLKLTCDAETISRPSCVYGLYNRLANSISVQNNFIYATVRGVGEEQKAIGVYTNGRFGRFVGNNIKANGMHSIAKKKEQAHATGFINEGTYTLLSDNNLIGEWGGHCIGLETKADFAKIVGNKILSTHTVWGSSLSCRGHNTLIQSNIITSTARNARILDLYSSYLLVTDNLIESLTVPPYTVSGCGIYAMSGAQCIIKDNIIKNATNCGIFTYAGVGTVKDNRIIPWKDALKEADEKTASLFTIMDEKRIVSLPDDE